MMFEQALSDFLSLFKKKSWEKIKLRTSSKIDEATRAPNASIKQLFACYLVKGVGCLHLQTDVFFNRFFFFLLRT